jgi:hypothetical protein
MQVRHACDSDRIAVPVSAGKKSHACDVYGSRDFKYPSRGVLYNTGRFEGLSVESASRDGKCQFLTVDISTGSILAYSKCLLTTVYLCWYTTVCCRVSDEYFTNMMLGIVQNTSDAQTI